MNSEMNFYASGKLSDNFFMAHEVEGVLPVQRTLRKRVDQDIRILLRSVKRVLSSLNHQLFLLKHLYVFALLKGRNTSRTWSSICINFYQHVKKSKHSVMPFWHI